MGVAFLVLAWNEGGSGAEFRAGAAIVLWLAVILGLVLGLWPRAEVPRPAVAAGLCLAALAGLTGLSLSWATDSGHAFTDLVRVLAYLGLFVCVVLASSAGGARPWLAGLALGVAAVACVAIVSAAFPALFEGSRELRADLGAARARLSFPTGYWNGLGLVMAIGIVLFSWLSAEGRTRLSRAVACAPIPIAGVVLVYTFSRGSLIALAVGLAVLFLLGRSRPVLAGSLAVGTLGAAIVLAALTMLVFRAEDVAARGDSLTVLQLAFLGVAAIAAVATGLARWTLDRRLAALRPPRWTGRAVVAAAAGLAALAVGLELAGVLSVDPLERVGGLCRAPAPGEFESQTAHLASASSSGRCQYWEAGIRAFASAPVSGIGAGGFEAWWGEHHSIPTPVSFAHSLFIGTAAELGVAGLALVVAFVGIPVVAGLRGRTGRFQGSARAAALAILAAGIFSATIDWMWQLPAAFAPVVVAAALLTGPALSPPSGTPRGRFGLGVGALVVGWLTIVASLLGLFGESKVGESSRLLEQGRDEAAIEAAQTATTLMPWSAEPYLVQAAALESMGELGAASDAVDEALERAPGDWRVWAVAARIQAAQGDVADALAALSEANRRNPSLRLPDEGPS